MRTRRRATARVLLFILGSALVLGLGLVVLWQTLGPDDLSYQERTDGLHELLERELDEIDFPSGYDAIGTRRGGCFHPVAFLCSEGIWVMRTFDLGAGAPRGRAVLDPLIQPLERQGFEPRGSGSCLITLRKDDIELGVTYAEHRDFFDRRNETGATCPRPGWDVVYVHAFIRFGQEPGLDALRR